LLTKLFEAAEAYLTFTISPSEVICYSGLHFGKHEQLVLT